MSDINPYPPCARRQKLVHFKSDGSQGYTERCLEQSAPTANRDVSAEECHDCPVRTDLLKKDKATGAYKPPATTVKLFKDLSKWKDTGAKDGFPACDMRLVVRIPSCCGKTEELRVCDCPNFARYGADVTPHICQQCPHRSPQEPSDERG